MGIGFLHTSLIGVYNGSPTFLISPLDFAQNPLCLFHALSRYKVKDTYATAQMLDFAMNRMAGKGFSLHEMKNLMITTETRPRTDIYQKVRLHFAPTGVDRTSINTIYSHVLNPMISSRSYMSTEPIELWLDTKALRQGLIYPVDPDSDPTALRIQDSGIVPVSTQIAIVNPETSQLCRIGEFGEIWVQSEACARSFYMSKQLFDEERFNGRIQGGDPNQTYIRTGDLGFLHNVTRPVGANNQLAHMQILFVLGNIGETFEVNGLNHFPVDIENSVEKCHRNITQGGCAVFQAGGLVVVLVEVYRKAYLASVVPVIVNTILNEHQIIVDIVAFVGQGDFPRSRLMEKQRGKILASWVTRKLRTIAQFGIRDPDAVTNQISEVPEPRERNTSGTLSKSVTNQDMMRGSSTSEGGTGVRASVDGGTSIMPELPLSLPDNHYHIDSAAIYEVSGSTSQEQTPIAGGFMGQDFPDGPIEMPAENYDSDAENRGPEARHDYSFDPNADPYRPYGNYTPTTSDPDLTSHGLSKLKIVNPEPESPDEVPHTATTYADTATPTSARPLTATKTSESAWVNEVFEDERSPYEDQGNPFQNDVPVPTTVPNFRYGGIDQPRSVTPDGPPPRSAARFSTVSAITPEERALAMSSSVRTSIGSPISPQKSVEVPAPLRAGSHSQAQVEAIKAISSVAPANPPSGPPSAPLPALPPQNKGRAALPSQQARFGTMNIATAGAYTSSLQNGNNNAMSPGLGGGPRHMTSPTSPQPSFASAQRRQSSLSAPDHNMQSRNREPSGGSTDSYRMDGLADDVVASRAVLYQTNSSEQGSSSSSQPQALLQQYNPHRKPLVGREANTLPKSGAGADAALMSGANGQGQGDERRRFPDMNGGGDSATSPPGRGPSVRYDGSGW